MSAWTQTEFFVGGGSVCDESFFYAFSVVGTWRRSKTREKQFMCFLFCKMVLNRRRFPGIGLTSQNISAFSSQGDLCNLISTAQVSRKSRKFKAKSLVFL